MKSACSSNLPVKFERWLRRHAGECKITPLAGDASARQYYRVRARDKTYIAMHSPKSEKPEQFLKVGRFLTKHKVRAPHVTIGNAGHGFILMEDFGDVNYLSRTKDKAGRYAAACRALIHMQTLRPPTWLPSYDERLLRREMTLYPTWYRRQLQQKPLSTAAQKIFRRAAAFVVHECAMMPRVFVHRDYHARNLMHIDGGSPGILDFQDAVVGPPAYDIVSLLRDAYVFLPLRRQYEWLEQYRREAVAAGAPLPKSEDAMRRDFNIVGAQRGLKVLGIFARLYLRDDKPGYLQDMPRVYKHLTAACRAVPELSALGEVVAEAPPCK